MMTWTNQAIQLVLSEAQRSADTHLFQLPMPRGFENIQLYLKDESTHPTGSLKHRLARSLFLYALCNGYISETTPVIEASSGSTAVSEAYFARMLGLKFIAVMPETTSKQKQAQIEFYGGECHLVKGRDIYGEAERLAKDLNGHYMDQFTYAERATDWRGNNNVAESIYRQMQMERFAEPSWIVVSAGTGGTSATIGRYIKYRGVNTKLCVADPSHSVFYDSYKNNDANLTCEEASAIEGIGRPRVEPSFVPSVIDRMIKVPDASAFACMQYISGLLGIRVGGSTGTNMYASYQLANELRHQGKSGSVVTMLCDRGDRYVDTYYNARWLEESGYSEGIKETTAQLEHFYSTGEWH